MDGTVFHNVLCQCRTQSADVGEQVFACCVEVYAHGIDTAFNRKVECPFQFGLVHIMLILSDAYALRVDFHQLCQRVHQSAAYAYRTTHGDIFIRKLFSGCF